MIRAKSKPPAFTAPTEGVEIDLGDGKPRELRFTLRSLHAMREQGLTRGLIAEEHLPVIVWIGLHDEAGNPPDDITPDVLRGYGIAWTNYLTECCLLAMRQAAPEEKKDETMASQAAS